MRAIHRVMRNAVWPLVVPMRFAACGGDQAPTANVAPTFAPTTAPRAAAANNGPTATPRTGSGMAAPTSAATGPTLDSVVQRYIFPDIPFAMAEKSIANDRKINLVGLGSDLWHGANDAPNEFWMITDRGPNGQIAVARRNP